jgi:proteasome component ECM29
LDKFIFSCYKNLQHSTKLIQQTSCKSLGIFSRYKPLQYENPEEKLDTNSIFEAIGKFISSNDKDRNLLEVAISSLKSFILGSESSTEIEKLCKMLFSLSKYEQEDLHFTISETLCCVSGWISESAPEVTFESSFLIENLREKKSKKNCEELVDKVLSRILKETLSSGKIQERCAASIWLLGFVNYAGKNDVVQKKLNNIQAAFSLLLSDPNQITQEVSSKGLVLLYEIGSEESKKMLVEDLVMTLQTGKKKY